jgi:hypothetical protein
MQSVDALYHTISAENCQVGIVQSLDFAFYTQFTLPATA